MEPNTTPPGYVEWRSPVGNLTLAQCARCAALVGDTGTHDDYHRQLEAALRDALATRAPQ